VEYEKLADEAVGEPSEQVRQREYEVVRQ